MNDIEIIKQKFLLSEKNAITIININFIKLKNLIVRFTIEKNNILIL